MSVKNSKSNNKSSRTVLKYLPGIVTGTLISLLGEAGIAGLYLKINDKTLLLFSGTYLIFAFASFLCGYITQKQTKEKGIKVGGLSGCVLGIIISLINCLLASFNKVGLFIAIIPILQAGMSSLGGIIAANRRKRY